MSVNRGRGRPPKDPNGSPRFREWFFLTKEETVKVRKFVEDMRNQVQNNTVTHNSEDEFIG